MVVNLLNDFLGQSHARIGYLKARLSVRSFDDAIRPNDEDVIDVVVIAVAFWDECGLFPPVANL